MQGLERRPAHADQECWGGLSVGKQGEDPRSELGGHPAEESLRNLSEDIQ